MGYTNLLIMSLIVALVFIYVCGDPLPESGAEPESGSKAEPESEAESKAEPERNSATFSYGPGFIYFFQIMFLLPYSTYLFLSYLLFYLGYKQIPLHPFVQHRLCASILPLMPFLFLLFYSNTLS